MWEYSRNKYRKEHRNNRQRGAATVEAVVAFVGFLFVIFTILNVVNFCRAQVLISNAVDTVTKELTQYSYLYQISGLQKFDSDIRSNAQTGKDNLNMVAGSVGDLYSAMSTAADTTIAEGTGLANATMDGSLTGDMLSDALGNLDSNRSSINASINNMTTEFATVGDNPVLYMKSIVAVAGSEGLDALKSHLIAAPLAKALMVKHFGGSWSEADRQLEALGVVDGLDGMNFGMSTLFSQGEEEDVHIVVYYKLKVVQIFPWADFEASMCKESRARAWLGGDDVVVKVAAQVPESGAGGDGSGGNPPAQTPEEDGDTAPDAEALRAAMVAKYGQETVDAVSAGEDTSTWTEDDWEYQIWLYQNEEPEDNGGTGEQLQILMSAYYGADTVAYIMSLEDTSDWTFEQWLSSIWYYQTYIFPVISQGQEFTDLDVAVSMFGMTREQFSVLKNKDINSLSVYEKAELKTIRDSVPAPNNTTLMQKVFPAEDLEKYLSGDYTQVTGFITKYEDVSQLTTYDDIYSCLRLDYENTKFNPEQDEAMYAIRFTTNETSNIRIPYSPDFCAGGMDTGTPPFTGNGFTKSENGQLIPEYKCTDDRVTPNDGAQIVRIGKDGSTEVVAVYNAEAQKFLPIEN